MALSTRQGTLGGGGGRLRTSVGGPTLGGGGTSLPPLSTRIGWRATSLSGGGSGGRRHSVRLSLHHSGAQPARSRSPTGRACSLLTISLSRSPLALAYTPASQGGTPISVSAPRRGALSRSGPAGGGGEGVVANGQASRI